MNGIRELDQILEMSVIICFRSRIITLLRRSCPRKPPFCGLLGRLFLFFCGEDLGRKAYAGCRRVAPDSPATEKERISVLINNMRVSPSDVP